MLVCQHCFSAGDVWVLTHCRIFDPPDDNPVQRFSKSVVPNGKRVKDQTFGFDRIFDDNTTQEEVFEATTKDLLDNVLDGYNATVFAYGATGCGKTHTITGTPQEPGIIHLTMQDLFERIAEKTEEKIIEVSLSYLEIYNETIRDLLVPGGSKAGLMLREDATQGVSVAGLSSHRPQNVQEVMSMIREGNAYRTMSPTEANATSSRSHAVLQINVSQKDRNAPVDEDHTMAALSIIDLAGSERASATKNRGDRLIEGANINKSLLALGSCINALCDPRKKNHVPYRNSKLTRLLKFSLGGNCKTVMIVCVSPSSQHFDETQNTLRYANRAKNIQTKVTRNTYNVSRHVKDYLVKINEQMAMITHLQDQQKEYERLAFQRFRKQSEKRELIAREGIARIRSAYSNSAAERQEKLGNMKNLRQIERRIAMISSWVAAFDQVCDNHEEEGLPDNLQAMRKTAQGILIELEGSRQHYHQRLAKSNWQRAIDSAVQNSVKQLAEVDGVGEGSDTDSLIREAELLKSSADREALLVVAEQDKAAKAAVVQTLLRAHFETVAAIGGILEMDESEAIEVAKGILGQILGASMTASSQVIKPDGSMVLVEAFPPTRSGTPKRKKPVSMVGLGVSPMKPNLAALLGSVSQPTSSPMRASPKRRKVIVGKKGVSFTPKKKTPLKNSKRVVRWRDDTQDGALEEFEKTPKKLDFTPEVEAPEPIEAIVAPMMPPPLPVQIGDFQPSSSESSPIPAPPTTSFNTKSKNNRFKAGFLAKKTDGSPLPPTLTNFSSDSDHSPLRDLEPSKASNRSALQYVENAASDGSFNGSSHISSSDNEDKWKGDRNDAMTIKSALKRASSGAGGYLNSSSTAVRAQRRRSPTAATSGSPPGENATFTASHSRRMVKSEKENDWKPSILSPRSAPVIKGRRTTLGEGRPKDAGLAGREPVRPSAAVTGSGGNARGSLMVAGKGNWR